MPPKQNVKILKYTKEVTFDVPFDPASADHDVIVVVGNDTENPDDIPFTFDVVACG